MPRQTYSPKVYNIPVIKQLFANYPDRSRLHWFLDVCRYGTPIHAIDIKSIPDRAGVSRRKSPPSSEEQLAIALGFLKLRRIQCLVGPLPWVTCRQLKGVTVNSMFALRKPDGTYRSIINMSDKSGTGVSVNMRIHKKDKKVVYIREREIIEILMAAGPLAHFWVKDLVDGFYNVSIREEDIKRLCIRFDGQLYAFQRLPMGLASSPKIFTEFMHFPLWAIANDRPDLYFVTVDAASVDVSAFRDQSSICPVGDGSRIRIRLIESYVDDIFGVHPSVDGAWEQWRHSETIFKKCNLECKLAKGRKPDQTNILLGKEYCIRRQWLRLGDKKLEKYMTYFSEVLAMPWIPARSLMAVIGKGRHMASIYECLAAFARGLEDFIFTRDPSRHWDPIKNSEAVQMRFRCLMECMQIANRVGVPFRYFTRPRTEVDFTIHTDASLTVGVGGIIEGKIDGESVGFNFQHRWDEIDLFISDRRQRDIQWRELAAIYCAVLGMEQELGDRMNDMQLHIFTDNMTCKYLLITMCALLRRPDLQVLINRICLLCVHRRVKIWMDHIPGKQNVIADALSRFFLNPLGDRKKELGSRWQLQNVLQDAASRTARFAKKASWKPKAAWLINKDWKH